MLNGPLKVERADNGIILSWHEGRAMNACREVFVTSGALVNRLDSLLDIFALDGLAVEPIPQAVQPGPDPATPDGLVAQLLPAGSAPGED